MKLSSASIPRRLRNLLGWVIALLILVFLFRRFAADWPVVQTSLGKLQWGWIAASLVPGCAYFLMRATAWWYMLRAAGILAPWTVTQAVWVNGEMVRYIPGNVWSVLGRVAQAGRLQTTRRAVFVSMILEAALLVFAAAAFSVLFLLPYPGVAFPGKAALGLLVFAVLLGISTYPVLRPVLRLAQRFIKAVPQVPERFPVFPSFVAQLASWFLFALFHLCVVLALGYRFSLGTAGVYAGCFVAAWLIGYLSVLTPSGIGVREAVLVGLFLPFLPPAEALVLAVVSRVLMFLLEILWWAVSNLAPRLLKAEQRVATGV